MDMGHLINITANFFKWPGPFLYDNVWTDPENQNPDATAVAQQDRRMKKKTINEVRGVALMSLIVDLNVKPQGSHHAISARWCDINDMPYTTNRHWQYILLCAIIIDGDQTNWYATWTNKYLRIFCIYSGPTTATLYIYSLTHLWFGCINAILTEAHTKTHREIVHNTINNNGFGSVRGRDKSPEMRDKRQE